MQKNGEKESDRRQQSTIENYGLDPAWNDDFPWMLPTEDGMGMVCSLCHKHSRRPKKSVVVRAVWTDVPCQSITRHTLVKHSRSESHIEAVKMEATLRSSRADGGIRMAFERAVSAERKARIG